MLRKSSLFIVVGALIAATNSWAVGPGSGKESVKDLAAVGAVVPVVRVRPESAEPENLARRMGGIAAVVAGKEQPLIAPVAVSQAFAKSPGRADLLAESADRIGMHLDTAKGEMLIVSGRVADDFASAEDVGPARAHAVFEKALSTMVAEKLVDPEGVAVETARTGRLMQGETKRGEKSVTRVKEYFFEVPRTIAGVEVFGSSLTVSVHRSGRIASVRTVGPVVTPTTDRVKRVVSAASLLERTRKENPRAEVVPMGLRYVATPGASEAERLLRPREAFRVTPVSEIEGRKLRGRSHYVFHAIDNEHEAALVWPRPNPEAQGDQHK
jgi:hypothetical protein